jgi:hypothetical protein
MENEVKVRFNFFVAYSCGFLGYLVDKKKWKFYSNSEHKQ